MVLAVIGIGNMGQALVTGFLRKGLLNAKDIRVFDIDENKATGFSRKTGCELAESATDAVDKADYVLIAVKPQVFDQAMETVAHRISSTTVVISIAAAVSVSRIQSFLRKGTPVVRVMPNTPALAGAGVSAICFSNTNDKQRELIIDLLKTCGMVIPCDEITLDAIGSVSGTGPAYVMLFIEAMADAAVKLGISRKVAYEIAAMTVYGSGKLVIDTGLHPAILKDQVCSPGGTTIEGVISLEKNGFRSAVHEAVSAAAKKKNEMTEAKK
ncbi:MAG: pyrroline-5-carboxylate reductase [Clostridiaceae bacterium]|nr:pyrroline-5-carboxylate reductase [Clostridiaceae bacterium]